MSMPDNRVAPRKAQNHRVKLCSSMIGAAIDCFLKDMSASGARLALPADLSPYAINWPRQVMLQIPMDRVEVDCVLVRRRNHDLAVRFVSVFRPVSRLKYAA